MSCPQNKIDSNSTGLRYAVEECLRELPGSPVWFPLEPNSYGDFGAKIKTVARNPINPSRQRQKGVVVDLDANASFQMDLTHTNHARLMQGFMFAAAREKPTTLPLNDDVVTCTAVATADDSFAVADATAATFLANTLVYASGFTNSANNGLHLCAAPTTGKIVVTTNLTNEAAPPADAGLVAVGFQFTTADLSIVITSGLPVLTSVAKDLTTLGLIPGEWIYIGGDVAGNTFASGAGYARIKSIATNAIVLDKVNWDTPIADAGTGKTIRIFFGTVIKNESTANLIVRQSYQFERTLGEDDDGTMSEVVVGCVANELSLEMKSGDKMGLDLSFSGCDAQSYSGLDGLQAGGRPDLVASDAYNSTSDMKRTAIAILDPTTSVPDPLFAYCTDVSLKISNNISGAKAIGTLGNFDMNTGMFDVNGSLSAYFQNVEGTQAVRDNADITFDMILAKDNAGLAFDIPLISLGNGMPKVEQDKSIMLPLDTMGAESTFGHTLLYVNFPYLPTASCV
jgi:hypothetical protein